MDPRASAFWVRLKANRFAYTLTILATLAVGILIGTIVSYGVKGKEAQKSSNATPLSVPAPQQLSNAFSQISKQLEPSVVNINTESTIKNPHRRRSRPGTPGGPDEENPFEDFFDRFFGGPGGEGGPGGDGGSIRERSLGSGVIVDPKGYIVTNRHVVEKADRIRVRLQDDTPTVLHDATVVGTDQETDLAVIKIDMNKSLPAAKLGNSDSMQVGEWVLAIGSPSGPKATVTSGNVAHRRRSIPVDGKEIKNGDELVADIANKKPGTKAKLTIVRNGKKQDTTVTVADRSKLLGSRLGEEEESNDQEQPKESKFGVTVRPLTPEIADRLDVPAGKGVIVQDVKPGSFGDDVGLTRGDVVLETNKQPVNSADDFNRIESSLKSGQDVVFLVRPRGAGRQDGTIFIAGTLP